MKQSTSKVTPITATLNYEAMITGMAQEYAPMIREAFPTQSALLIALDNSVRYLGTASETMPKVTADDFCMHGPLNSFPNQLLALMVLFVASGVFVSTDPEVQVFSIKNASKWVFTGKIPTTKVSG